MAPGRQARMYEKPCPGPGQAELSRYRNPADIADIAESCIVGVQVHDSNRTQQESIIGSTRAGGADDMGKFSIWKG